MNWVEAAGYLASAYRCHRQQYCFHHLWVLRQRTPCLVPHAILLPPNAWRAILMLRLIRRVEAASKGSTGRLKPFMKEASLKVGETIFNKGDYADRLYMIIAGDVHLEQIDHILRAGDLFGEIGLFSADHQRIQAARTMTDVHLLWISERELAQSAIKILEWPSISCG